MMVRIRAAAATVAHACFPEARTEELMHQLLEYHPWQPHKRAVTYAIDVSSHWTAGWARRCSWQ
jgi:hypothetical protein